MAVIDGVNGNHHARIDEVKQMFAPEEKRLYDRLKEAYNDKESEINEELCHDMAVYK